ncbi:hypothetical protein MFAL_02840 [Mycolicibacterium fallax]|nr:hypothetical protein MFAL_02840 [Mycolicibacterium fallax]
MDLPASGWLITAKVRRRAACAAIPLVGAGSVAAVAALSVISVAMVFVPAGNPETGNPATANRATGNDAGRGFAPPMLNQPAPTTRRRGVHDLRAR